jgi:hypothetical protein
LGSGATGLGAQADGRRFGTLVLIVALVVALVVAAVQ